MPTLVYKCARFLCCTIPLAVGGTTKAEDVYRESPRSAVVDLRIGGYKPLIDSETSLSGQPYQQVFGGASMLLVELEVDYMLYQGVGTAGIGAALGYAEKYAAATITGSNPPTSANESTYLKVLPIHAVAFYRMDYAALHYNVPLTPYVKAGLVYIPWWEGKGGNDQASGGRWGYGFTGGLALLLDFFEPRLARDFDSDLGVNHTYLFAEYDYDNVTSFGRPGFDLSSRRWMFGLSLEF